MIERHGLAAVALRRVLLPYVPWLRHWFHVGLDDCLAMGRDELAALLSALGGLPAPGWSLALHGDPKSMPEVGRTVEFVMDLRPK